MDEPTNKPPTNTDPQALVDEALSVPTPTAEPISETPVSSPNPPSTASTAVQEDTPLAFVAPPPTVSGASTTDPKPEVAVQAPTTPVSSSDGLTTKKKPMGGKILLALFGIVSLVAALGGGWYMYQQMQVKKEEVRISAISEAECNGCSKDVDGGWLVWRNGQCKVTGVCNSSKNPKQNTDDPTPSAPPSEKSAPAECDSKTADKCCGTGYLFCGGKIKKCVLVEELNKAGGGCDKYGEVVYGIPSEYGADAKRGTCDQDKVNSGLQTQCTCGSESNQTYCFEKRGLCAVPGERIERNDGTFVETGFCGLVGSYSSLVGGTFTEKANLFNNDGTYKYNFDCDENGCQSKQSECLTAHYQCAGGLKSGNSCTEDNADKKINTDGSKTTFNGRCGTVEQIDVSCNVGGTLTYIASRTKVNPPCQSKPEKTPTPSASTPSKPSSPPNSRPTLVCRSLTKDKVDEQIVVGTQLTFTCSGASSPAGSVPLSYQFQVSKDGGAWQSLSATGSTATYTVPAYGDYDVRCRACGQINNANVCNPVWQGAT